MFCVYWTYYSGNLLPKFYIGSSSISKIQKGYKGSVKSKLYHSIWKSEIKNNPHLFSVFVIKYFSTRIEALEFELQLQIIYDVVKNPNFINQSLATVNGFFGRTVPREHHPMFGKKHSQQSKMLISKNHHDVRGSNNPMFGKPSTRGMLNKKHSDETKAKMKLNQWDRSGSNNPMAGITGKDHPSFGHKLSADHLAILKKPKELITCPHCGKSGGKPAMIRFHFNACKLAS